jgi:transcriptional regulator with XRE-family HTH domain
MSLSAHDANRERHWTCARRISDRRHSLGLTQNEVVERLETLGVCATNRTLSAMEHGQGVDVGRLPEVAIALDCTVTYLLGLTADPSSWLPGDTSADGAPPHAAPLVTVPLAAAGSWILGPDIPDRTSPVPSGSPRA